MKWIFAGYRHSGEILWITGTQHTNEVQARMLRHPRNIVLLVLANPCSASRIADFQRIGSFLTYAATAVTGYVEKLWETCG